MDEEIFAKELTPIFESQEYKNNIYPILKQKPKDIRVIEFKEERAQKKALIHY